jgi:MFS family permease
MPFRAWKLVSKDFKRLGYVSMLADITSEMLNPINPIFLTQVLGISAPVLGLIEGLADAASALLKVLSGRWSDRLKKRTMFVVSGYILSSIAKPLVGISTSLTQVLGARCLDRVGKGLRTSPRDALIGDSTPKRLQGMAFGVHRAMDTTGAILGPLVTLSLLLVWQS